MASSGMVAFKMLESSFKEGKKIEITPIDGEPYTATITAMSMYDRVIGFQYTTGDHDGGMEIDMNAGDWFELLGSKGTFESEGEMGLLKIVK